MSLIRPSSISPWSRLQLSWFGRIYINHLKKYNFVSCIAGWLWRNGYPVYISVSPTNRKRKRWRALNKLSEFAEVNRLQIHKFFDASSIEILIPKVLPKCNQDYFASRKDRFEFPEIFVAVIRNAIIFGRTNLICTNGEVVCHDLYEFDHDSTSEELHGRVVIEPKSHRIRWLHHDDTPRNVSKAAVFVDACSTNYAHWLTEVLPRIAAFCSEDSFNGVPIVVDDGLHKNIMESLRMVTGPKREIIRLAVGSALSVQELYVTSVAGYVPFGRRSSKLSGHSHGIFSPHAFEVLRTSIAPFIKKKEAETSLERIFLRRKSGARGIINASEIERFLLANGYTMVEPEKLTFSEQVRLFNNAKYIISPTGAALTNAIFCKPGTQVMVLMGKHEDMIYRYWINLLGPLGINVSYVLGDITRNRGHGIHGDFSIDSNHIRDLLKDF